jgi:hypothetical protein
MTLGCLEEGLEVPVDHAVQHSVLGVARPIVRSAEGPGRDMNAGWERRQCPKVDTPQKLGFGWTSG